MNFVEEKRTNGHGLYLLQRMRRGAAEKTADYFSGRFTLYVLIILFIAASLRVALFLEQRYTPLHNLHLWEESDMAFYDSWSDAIRNGDWLSARVGHPYVSPHRYVSRYLHEKYNLDQPFDDKIAADTWHEWFGGARFHQAPFYPYFIALSKGIGFGVHGILVLQILLGVASVGLLILIARYLFGPETALLAGLMAAFHGPFLFYEQLLLRTGLYTFIILLTMWLTLRCARQFDSNRLPWWTGCIYGIGILMKPTLIPVTLIAAVWLVWRGGKSGVRPALILCAGAGVVLLPAVLRNVYLGVQPLGFSSVGAFGIAAALVPTQPGQGYALSKVVAEVMGQAQGDGWATIKAVAASHESLWSFVEMLWQRWLVFLVPAELPNNVSYLYYHAASSVLRLAPVHWGLLIWPALVGIALSLKRIRDTLPLIVVILMGVTQLLLFFVLSRYRAPLTMALLPFAAWSVVLAVKQIIERRRVRLLMLLVGGIIAQPWLLEQMGVEVTSEIRNTDIVVSRYVWDHMVQRQAREERIDSVINTLDHALTHQRLVLERVPMRYSALIKPWPKKLMRDEAIRFAKHAENIVDKVNSPELQKRFREAREAFESGNPSL
jgi:hypothetical protein